MAIVKLKTEFGNAPSHKKQTMDDILAFLENLNREQEALTETLREMRVQASSVEVLPEAIPEFKIVEIVNSQIDWLTAKIHISRGAGKLALMSILEEFQAEVRRTK